MSDTLPSNAQLVELANFIESGMNAQEGKVVSINKSIILTVIEALRAAHEPRGEAIPERVFDLTAELRRYFDGGPLDHNSDLYLLLKEVEAMRTASPPEAGPACEHGYYRFCPTCHPQSACSSVTKGPEL
jgi:hypothetical protein